MAAQINAMEGTRRRQCKTKEEEHEIHEINGWLEKDPPRTPQRSKKKREHHLIVLIPKHVMA